MRAIRCFFFLAAVALLFADGLPVRAEDVTSTAPATPEEALRRFYAWYVPALAGGGDLLAAGRRGELRRYVSGRFLGRIDRARRGPDGLDGDPFLDAQDFDPQWGKQIAVREIATRGDGTWKLDHVGSRE